MRTIHEAAMLRLCTNSSWIGAAIRSDPVLLSVSLLLRFSLLISGMYVCMYAATYVYALVLLCVCVVSEQTTAGHYDFDHDLLF